MTEQPVAATHPEVWVPRSLVTGCGGLLTKPQRLAYLVIADRADNRTRELRWNASDVAERCGMKDQRSARAALKALVDANLVEIVEESDRKKILRVQPVRSNGRLVVPLAAVWSGAEGGPRAKTNPAGAFAALLGLLYVANFDTMRARVRQETLAQKIGCQRRQLIRDLEDLRDVLTDKVLIEAPTRYEGRWGATEYTIVWDNLPVYLTRAEIAARSERAVDSPDEQITEVVSEIGDHGTITDLCDGLREILHQSGVAPMPRLERQSEKWPAAVVSMVDDGYSFGQIGDLILWATEDPFWSVQIGGMADIRKHAQTIAQRKEFQDWVTTQPVDFWDFTPAAPTTQGRSKSRRSYAPAHTPDRDAYRVGAGQE